VYLDVEVNPGGEWSLDINKVATLFVYIMQGDGSFGSDRSDIISTRHALLFDAGTKF